MREEIGLLDRLDQPLVGPLVFAFDPGVSTGWALYDRGANLLTAGQASGEDVLDQYDHLLTCAGAHVRNDIVVVIESFIIPAQPKVRNIDMTFPIEMIGALKYVTRTHEITEVKMQLPKVRDIASEKLLTRFGWPVFTARDQTSATKHLFAYFIQQNAVPTFQSVVG